MTQYHAGPPPYQASVRPKNWIGGTALAVAVLGLVLCWSVLGGVVLGVVALILGVSGHRRVQRREADNPMVAGSGIALGVLAIVVSLALIPAWTRFFREVRMPAYLTCVAATTDQEGAQRCADEFQKRIDALFRADDSSASGNPGST